MDHWAVADDQEKLFDPVASGLILLDLSDMALMGEIYAENGAGWVKIAVVRDPVTRLLSAYLDLKQLLEKNNGVDSSAEVHRQECQFFFQLRPYFDAQQDVVIYVNKKCFACRVLEHDAAREYHLLTCRDTRWITPRPRSHARRSPLISRKIWIFI